jgi:hypothetical protein
MISWFLACEVHAAYARKPLAIIAAAVAAAIATQTAIAATPKGPNTSTTPQPAIRLAQAIIASITANPKFCRHVFRLFS